MVYKSALCNHQKKGYILFFFAATKEKHSFETPKIQKKWLRGIQNALAAKEALYAVFTNACTK